MSNFKPAELGCRRRRSPQVSDSLQVQFCSFYVKIKPVDNGNSNLAKNIVTVLVSANFFHNLNKSNRLYGLFQNVFLGFATSRFTRNANSSSNNEACRR